MKRLLIGLLGAGALLGFGGFGLPLAGLYAGGYWSSFTSFGPYASASVEPGPAVAGLYSDGMWSGRGGFSLTAG